ncbi:hypothetical protein IFVP22_C1200166 [Vibrio parahaemolyticus]
MHSNVARGWLWAKGLVPLRILRDEDIDKTKNGVAIAHSI